MSHKRASKRSQQTLDEYPESFDDTFFHNELVESNSKIPVLRHIVYKKIKSAIIERIESYKGGDISLSDEFDVEFNTSDYSFTDFEWAVIREEIMDLGFDVFTEVNDGKLTGLKVHVERSIELSTPNEDTPRIDSLNINDEMQSQ